MYSSFLRAHPWFVQTWPMSRYCTVHNPGSYRHDPCLGTAHCTVHNPCLYRHDPCLLSRYCTVHNPCSYRHDPCLGTAQVWKELLWPPTTCLHLPCHRNGRIRVQSGEAMPCVTITFLRLIHFKMLLIQSNWIKRDIGASNIKWKIVSLPIAWHWVERWNSI